MVVGTSQHLVEYNEGRMVRVIREVVDKEVAMKRVRVSDPQSIANLKAGKSSGADDMTIAQLR